MQNGAVVAVTKNSRNDIYDISCTILGTLSHRTNKVVRIIVLFSKFVPFSM